MPLLTDHVLFLDGEALILDKPAGLPVDAPRDGSMSLENHLASLTFGFQRWPLAVHRLDRDTSGCLLLARNPKAHKRFAAAFEAQAVTKVYHGVLAGVPVEQEGRVGVLTVLLHWLRGTELRSQAFGADGAPMGDTRRGHSSESVSLEQACRAILRGVARRERELVIPWKLKALTALNALRPRSAEAIVRRAVSSQDTSPAE